MLLSPVLFSCACILRFIISCGVNLGPLEVEAAAAEDLPTGVRESYKNKKDNMVTHNPFSRREKKTTEKLKVTLIGWIAIICTTTTQLELTFE